MLVYFSQDDKIVNTRNITYVDLIERSDYCRDPHVIIKFTDGSFVEFPPHVTMHEVFSMLTEGSTNG